MEISFLQFILHRLTLAVCSRIRRDGVVEIEIGLGDPRLPKSTFTADRCGKLRPLYVRGLAQHATAGPHKSFDSVGAKRASSPTTVSGTVLVCL